MIISHKHKYLFVELPRTGSSAISRELREYYDGKSILNKHSTYRDFLAQAPASQRNYFVFSCVRNPLDKTVSLYHKYKTSHTKLYTSGERLGRQNIFMRSLMKRQFRFVSQTDCSFERFFLRYYHLPYNDWASLDHWRFNRIIRFERLNDDFVDVLRILGITQVRSLPMVNVTRKGRKSFWDHYELAQVRRRAIWIFGPYVKAWGFDFPLDWQVTEVPASSMVAFRAANVFRNVYWRFMR